MRHTMTALPQHRRDEIAVAFAMLLTEITESSRGSWGYKAIELRDLPSGWGVCGVTRVGSWVSPADAARAFLRCRGFFQCVYTGEIMPVNVAR